MNTLDQTIRAAAGLAYQEDAGQVVGMIEGEWVIAHSEDLVRQAQMKGHTFRVGADGVNAADMTEFEEFLAQ